MMEPSTKQPPLVFNLIDVSLVDYDQCYCFLFLAVVELEFCFIFITLAIF